MKFQHRKARNRWIDFSLIGAIIALLTITIFLITTSDKDSLETVVEHSDPFTAQANELTEEDSAFPGIKIVSDISNDKLIPYAIQYPLTEDSTVNEAISQFIMISKDEYIQNVKEQQIEYQEDVQNELNISVETYTHNKNFYSFVLTKNLSVNGDKKPRTVETFVYNNMTKSLVSFRDLLQQDVAHLQLLVPYIQKQIKTDESLSTTLQQSQFETATAPKWRNFQNYALTENELIIYFDENTIANDSVGIPSVSIPLTYVNPILIADVQQPNIEISKTILASLIKDTEKKSVKRVALTFDDGPNPKTTEQILQTLKKYNAKATFFMLGSRVQYYPGIVRTVAKDGHEIGNHTWSHPNLTKLKSKQVLKEFNQTEQALFDVLGTHSTVFRPPYGATNERVKGLIPLTSVNWTIDTLDWQHKDPKKTLAIVKKNMHNNAIILMHDIHQPTADSLEAVLLYLTKEGYEFVTVSEILSSK